MSGTISLFCGLAVKGVLEKTILPVFLADSGCTLATTFEPTKVLERLIAGGARPDVVLGVKEAVHDLAVQGFLDLSTLIPLVRSGIGVAVPPEVSPPKISTTEELIRALLEARSVAYSSTGASGLHFATLLEKLDIAEQVNEHACILPGGFVAEALLDGRADLAVQQVIELASVPGVQIVGPLPDDAQNYVELWVGVAPGAPEIARLLVAHLTSRSAVQSYRDGGLIVIAPSGRQNVMDRENS